MILLITVSFLLYASLLYCYFCRKHAKQLLMCRKTYIAFLLVGVLLVACSPTRRLKDNESLLVENKVKITDGHYDKDQLLNIIKQKPNRKIFGLWRFHLWLYNTVSDEKIKIRREEIPQQHPCCCVEGRRFV